MPLMHSEVKEDVQLCIDMGKELLEKQENFNLYEDPEIEEMKAYE